VYFHARLGGQHLAAVDHDLELGVLQVDDVGELAGRRGRALVLAEDLLVGRALVVGRDPHLVLGGVEPSSDVVHRGLRRPLEAAVPQVDLHRSLGRGGFQGVERALGQLGLALAPTGLDGVARSRGRRVAAGGGHQRGGDQHGGGADVASGHEVLRVIP
jgi:hypothetical protein